MTQITLNIPPIFVTRNNTNPLAFKYKNMRKTRGSRQLSPYMQVVTVCKFN